MAAEERWYFTKEQLINTPSRKCGVDPDRELSYRQQAANFIQDMGQRLQVNQLCINTSIVYMHRFYMFHSFSKFHRNAISTCALFLAAKVEEQPRKLEHVIKVAHMCLHRDAPQLDIKSEAYLEQAQELVINENIMLQTLGFDVAIDHPHTHVVKCCQLVRGVWPSAHQHHASKDLAQTSYFMATNSLHLTTMCLQYKPTVVACVCIHLACKWANWEIPKSSEGKRWFWYVEKTVTEELLEELTTEFVAILDRCPSRLKRKMLSSSGMNEKLQESSLEKKLGGEIAHTSGSTSKTSSPSIQANPGAVSTSALAKADKVERSSASSSTTSSMSSLKSNLAEKTDGAATSSIDKNGNVNTVAQEWKERNKKEHITSTSAYISNLSVPPNITTSHSQLSSAKATSSPPPSPAKKLPAKGNTSTSSDLLPNITSDFTKSYLQSSSFTPPKAAKLDTSVHGMTPKEYREYKQRKKRERAEKEKDKISVVNQVLPNSGGKLERIERECAKGLGIGGKPLSSLNLQPVVSLTPLTLSNIAQLTAPKHSHSLSAQHSQKQQQKASEKPKSLPIGVAESAKSSNRHHRAPHQKSIIDDKIGARQHDGNHPNLSHQNTPVKSLAVTTESVPPPPNDLTPPVSRLPSSAQILTQSPPVIKEEDSGSIPVSKLLATPNALENRVPHVDVCTPPVKSFFKNEHRKKEKEELKGPSHSLVETPPPPLRQHETKETKERLYKHHKSKTPPVAVLPQNSEAPHSNVKQELLPGVPSATVSASVKLELKPEPSRMLTIVNAPPPNLISNDSTSVANNSPPKLAKQVVSQETLHSTLPLVLDAPHAEVAAVMAQPSVPTEEIKTKLMAETLTLDNPLPPPPAVLHPPTPPPLPRVPQSPPVVVVPEPPPPPLPDNEKLQQTVMMMPPQPSKHERREKHRHKDKDRDRERSHDRKVELPLAPATTPSIKLTIPKDRINLGASMSGHGNSVGNSDSNGGKKAPQSPPPKKSGGGLKLKIPKDKLVASTKTKGSNASLETPQAPVADESPARDRASGALKIKITKDRLSSKGVYNLSVESKESGKEKVDRESRKRERESNSKSAGQLPPFGVDNSVAECKPPKILKQSSRSSRRSTESNPPISNNPAVGGSITSPMDVPPSSNTRSSRYEQAPRHPTNSDGHHQHHMAPHHGRVHKSSKHHNVSSLGGGLLPPPPTFGHGHPVNMNAAAGPYPYNAAAQYYPPFPPAHGVSYYGAPPPPPMHRGDYPPPQFYNQFGSPPPHMHPPPPHSGMPYPPPPMMQQQQQAPPPPPPQQQRSMPPLPREPPPTIPPPPPPE